MLEEDLLRKLESIEALFAGAKTDGEREAAGRARERIRQRLLEFEERDPPVEYRFSVSNPWSQRLLCALLRRYGVRPYRYPRQRQTTVMARISESFVETTLWPEFVELDTVLQTHLNQVASRIIERAIHPEASGADVETAALG